MFDMMKKLQQAQAEMENIKRRLNDITVEGTSPEHKVKVLCTGNRVIRNIDISPELLHGEQSMLEDYLVLAINDALTKAEKVNEAEMKTAAAGMMPGLGGLFS